MKVKVTKTKVNPSVSAGVATTELLRPKADFIHIFCHIDFQSEYSTDKLLEFLPKLGKDAAANIEKTLTLPLVNTPVKGFFVVYTNHGMAPLVFKSRGGTTIEFYEEVVSHLSPFVNEVSARSISWYGESAGQTRAMFRLGAYDCSPQVRGVVHSLAYGSDSYDIEKAFNVTHCSDILPDVVMKKINAQDIVDSVMTDLKLDNVVSMDAANFVRVVALPLVYGKLCAYPVVNRLQLIEAASKVSI